MFSSDKITPFSLIAPMKCGNKVLHFDNPLVMGILNLTPDSFYDGGSYLSEDLWLRQTEKMITEGADIIDIGAMSSRPGAEIISEEEEIKRLLPPLSKLVKTFPEMIFSVDTFRGKIVKLAAKEGAHLINDISAGKMDPDLVPEVAASGLPYVLMHMQGTPATMQSSPVYTNITQNIKHYFEEQIVEKQNSGIKSILIDPGFGFGKTIEHNYTILRELETFTSLKCPILIGISRKSMIYNVLNDTPQNVLSATSALNLFAIVKGASILRVHDVKEAKQIITLAKNLNLQN